MLARLIFLVIVFCVFSGINPAPGQQRRIDSLEKALDTAGPAHQALIRSELSWAYHASNPEKGLKYGLEALADFMAAKMEKEQAEVLLNIGICYYSLDHFEKAAEYFLRSLKIKEKLNDLNGVAALYNNMGNVFKEMNNIARSTESYRKGLEISRRSGNQRIIATTLANLAINFKLTGRYDSAIRYNQEALRIRESIGDRRGASVSLNNIAIIYADTAFRGMNRDTALRYLERSVQAKEEVGDRRGTGLCLVNIGQLYSDMHRYEMAARYIGKALELSSELKSPTLAMACYESFSDLYRKKGDYRSAFEYLSKYIVIKDSLFTEETTRKIAEMQVRYETEKKETENELLRKESSIRELQISRQKVLRNYLILSSLLILAIAIFLLSRYLMKQRVNRILEEKNRQLALLNATKDRFFSIIAHDLKNPFGALVSVSGQLSEKYESLGEEQKFRSIGLISRSAVTVYRLLENLLDWARSQTGMLPFRQEEFDISEVVDTGFEFIRLGAEKKGLTLLSGIPRNTMIFADRNMIVTVVNNLLANAVKFSERPGVIRVTGKQVNGMLEVFVCDEGIGMTAEELDKLFRLDVDTRGIGRSKEKGTGLGLILCREFIEKNGGTIRAASEQGRGSIFTFSVPCASGAEQ